MRLFLEIEDERTEDEERRGIPPSFIRIPVKDREEATFILARMRMYFRKPKAYLHYCYHDEEPQRPCKRERIA